MPIDRFNSPGATSLAPGQSYSYPSASETILKNIAISLTKWCTNETNTPNVIFRVQVRWIGKMQRFSYKCAWKLAHSTHIQARYENSVRPCCSRVTRSNKNIRPLSFLIDIIINTSLPFSDIYVYLYLYICVYIYMYIETMKIWMWSAQNHVFCAYRETFHGEFSRCSWPIHGSDSLILCPASCLYPCLIAPIDWSCCPVNLYVIGYW